MEDNQNVDKGFWVQGVFVPDENGQSPGNHTMGYSGQVKVTLGKPKKNMGRHEMGFKTVIPDYVIDKLKGKEIERERGGMNSNVRKYTYGWMNERKTITSQSLDELISQYERIMSDFVFVLNDERKPKQKCIFFKYKSRTSDNERSTGNGCLMGKKISMDYHFFVGYFNGSTYFDLNHKAFNKSYDDISKYTMVEWTEDREKFFEMTYTNFMKLQDNLLMFFANVDPENIDSAISNFKLISE